MTTKDYHSALKQLKLTHASKATAAAFGLSVRQCQRIATGESIVPGPLAKLLRLALRQGLTAKYLAEL